MIDSEVLNNTPQILSLNFLSLIFMKIDGDIKEWEYLAGILCFNTV